MSGFLATPSYVLIYRAGLAGATLDPIGATLNNSLTQLYIVLAVLGMRIGTKYHSAKLPAFRRFHDCTKKSRAFRVTGPYPVLQPLKLCLVQPT